MLYGSPVVCLLETGIIIYFGAVGLDGLDQGIFSLYEDLYWDLCVVYCMSLERVVLN
jgi:hypothetical protein